MRNYLITLVIFGMFLFFFLYARKIPKESERGCNANVTVYCYEEEYGLCQSLKRNLTLALEANKISYVLREIKLENPVPVNKLQEGNNTLVMVAPVRVEINGVLLEDENGFFITNFDRFFKENRREICGSS